MPSQYRKQCCFYIDWTLGNKIKSNLIQNTTVFIQQNGFQIDVCKTVGILSQPQGLFKPRKGFTFELFQVSVYIYGIECIFTHDRIRMSHRVMQSLNKLYSREISIVTTFTDSYITHIERGRGRGSEKPHILTWHISLYTYINIYINKLYIYMCVYSHMPQSVIFYHHMR